MSGQFYYWLTFVLNFIIPFVSLGIMNTVIIKTLYQISKSNLTETIKITKEDQSEDSVQGQKGQGQTNQMKTVEKANLHYVAPCYLWFSDSIDAVICYDVVFKLS